MVFAVALIAASINAWPIYQMLIASKSRQTVSQYAPETHKQKQGTPTMGGLIVAVGFLAGALPAMIASTFGKLGTNSPKSLAIIGLFAGFAAIGFIDDFVVPRYMTGKRGLGWKQKILMQLVVAGLCSWVLCDGFTSVMAAAVFLILFFSNAYNFSDGLDSLASLLLLALGAGLLLIAHMLGAVNLEPVLVALLGAILPFLYLNKPRAKVFMGYVGSLPIGAIVGVSVAAIAFPNDFDYLYTRPMISTLDLPPAYYRPELGFLAYFGLFVISGMMIVELVPVPLQILSVKLRKKRLFSFTPIHHAFERKGWTETKVVGAFFGCQLAMTLIAIALIHSSPKSDFIIRTSLNQGKPGVRWHEAQKPDIDLPFTGAKP